MGENNSLRLTRALQGTHGIWLSANGRAALVTSDVDLDNPAPELLTALESAGIVGFDANADTYGATVMMETACNLTCSYCFQNESADQSGGPARIPRLTLDSATVPAIRDFVAAQMDQHDKHALHLLLTGGEPLMNISICVELLRAMQSLNMQAAQMFSNGVLLTGQRASALIAAGLTNMQISFDGDRAHHDRFRKNHAGLGSYDRILTNLRALRNEH